MQPTVLNDLTNDKELLKSKNYEIIKGVLSSLIKSEGLSSFFGNCVASADIIQTMLAREGISSKILECQVAIVHQSPDRGKNFLFVGYDNYSYPGQIDTHTVVITEEEHPILIDLSLGHALEQDKPVIVERVNGIEPGVIADYTFGEVRLTYTEKKNLRLAQIHQKNLLQRLISEQNTQKTLRALKLLIVAAITLGLINFTLNITMIILRLFEITWV